MFCACRQFASHGFTYYLTFFYNRPTTLRYMYRIDRWKKLNYLSVRFELKGGEVFSSTYTHHKMFTLSCFARALFAFVAFLYD